MATLGETVLRAVNWLVTIVLALGLLLTTSNGAFADRGLAQTPPTSEREVAFTGSGGVKLAGTLVLPTRADGQRVPGVVYLPSGGQTDRNGNNAGSSSGSGLYKTMASALSDAGIASLRYDKRGVGASDPTPGGDAEATDFAAWENLVGDAAATLNYLQQQPEIDPARTALVGHSEGSILAEQVAAEGTGLANPPVALVLTGAPGRPFDVVVREIISNTVSEQITLGTPQDTAQLLLTTYDQEIARLRQNGQIAAEPLATLQNEGALSNRVKNPILGLFDSKSAKYWSGILKVDPAKMVATYSGPVLLMQGEKDTQVSPIKDAPALDAALKSRPNDDHETFFVPNASHWLKVAQAGADVSGTEGPVVPEAVSKLTTWLDAKFQSAATPAGQSFGAPLAVVLVGAGLVVIAALAVLLRRRLGSAAASD